MLKKELESKVESLEFILANIRDAYEECRDSQYQHSKYLSLESSVGYYFKNNVIEKFISDNWAASK